MTKVSTFCKFRLTADSGLVIRFRAEIFVLTQNQRLTGRQVNLLKQLSYRLCYEYTIVGIVIYK